MKRKHIYIFGKLFAEIFLYCILFLVVQFFIWFFLVQAGRIVADCHISVTGLFKTPGVYCPDNKDIENFLQNYANVTNDLSVLSVIAMVSFPTNILFLAIVALSIEFMALLLWPEKQFRFPILFRAAWSCFFSKLNQ